MLALPLGLLLIVIGVVVTSLIWGIVYNWFLAVSAVPLFLIAFALWLLFPTRKRRR